MADGRIQGGAAIQKAGAKKTRAKKTRAKDENREKSSRTHDERLSTRNTASAPRDTSDAQHGIRTTQTADTAGDATCGERLDTIGPVKMCDFIGSTSAATQVAQMCDFNGCTSEATRVCGGCKTAQYCNRACQLAAWKTTHRAECVHAHQARAARKSHLGKEVLVAKPDASTPSLLVGWFQHGCRPASILEHFTSRKAKTEQATRISDALMKQGNEALVTACRPHQSKIIKDMFNHEKPIIILISATGVPSTDGEADGSITSYASLLVARKGGKTDRSKEFPFVRSLFELVAHNRQHNGRSYIMVAVITATYATGHKQDRISVHTHWLPHQWLLGVTNEEMRDCIVQAIDTGQLYRKVDGTAESATDTDEDDDEEEQGAYFVI